MAAQIKPIKVYGEGGPNPPKVAMMLEELGVPYEVIPIPFTDVKKPEYLAINPNGRLPSIHDPNTGITVWESGAILEYLIEKYDSDHRFSFAPGTPEAYHAKQWLFFQATGQGPYFGQLAWFKKFHAEQVPSAIERYTNEVNRVTGVLDGYLAQQKKQHPEGDGPWLVGNKYSYADIAFISWQRLMPLFLEKDQYDPENYPHMKEWLDKMMAREPIKKVLAAPGH